MKFPVLRPKEAVVSYILFLGVFSIFPALAQNEVTNGSFETNGTTIAGADGTTINGWSVGARGSGDYASLSTIGTFPGNATPGVDLASFQLSGGGSAAAAGNYHIDVIGAAIGETNHSEQRLNSVLNQSISGLVLNAFYTVEFNFTTTSYVAEPREFAWRIDPEVGGVPDLNNPIVSQFMNIGFLPGDPAGVITLADREMFSPFTDPMPGNFSTLSPPMPVDLDDTFRTVAPNAVSATIDFDEVAGSSEAPVMVNWQTLTVQFQASSSDIRLSFFNNTDPFGQDESEYHYRTVADAMGKHDIWFGNEVGMLLDDVSIIIVPEPGAFLLLAVTALFFLLRRSGRRFSEPSRPAIKSQPGRSLS